MDDGVHGLLPSVREMLPERSRHPPMRQANRFEQPLPADAIRWQLVQWNDDVGTELLLRLNGRFGRELDGSGIKVRAEAHASLRHAQQRALVTSPCGAPPLELWTVGCFGCGEREYLEAARVGDDRASATHVSMQAAGFGHDVGTGMNDQVVRVAEHELHASVCRLRIGHALERRIRAHGHEAWRVDDAVRCMDATHAGPRLRGLVHELKPEEGLRLIRRKRVGRRCQDQRRLAVVRLLGCPGCGRVCRM